MQTDKPSFKLQHFLQLHSQHPSTPFQGSCADPCDALLRFCVLVRVTLYCVSVLSILVRPPLYCVSVLSLLVRVTLYCFSAKPPGPSDAPLCFSAERPGPSDALLCFSDKPPGPSDALLCFSDQRSLLTFSVFNASSVPPLARSRALAELPKTHNISKCYEAHDGDGVR